MVTREQKVTQSIQDYVRDWLLANDYTPDIVQVLDAFPEEGLTETFDRSFVAAGFSFDDGGAQAELGSDLKRRVYNVTFWIFGLTAVAGQNIANAIKAAIERDGTVPLKDIGASGEEIDRLVLLDEGGVLDERVPVREPRPWERNLWRVTARLEDYYNARLVA
jgi:hypothetical protein